MNERYCCCHCVQYIVHRIIIITIIIIGISCWFIESKSPSEQWWQCYLTNNGEKTVAFVVRGFLLDDTAL